MNTLSWGILGTGRIAGIFAEQLPQSRTGTLAAVGSRSQANANKFAARFNVPQAHGSYEALLADPGVQAIYLATPHPTHAEWCIKAAQAGKHILCEKPLTLNHAEAVNVINVVRRHDVFLMEAFMYRCDSHTAKLVELIREKIIGDVRVIHASVGFHREYDPEHRFFNNALGGGGILDLGCYPVSKTRLVAGVATGKPFADPVEVKGCAHFLPTGVDSCAVASLKFPGDILAELSTSTAVQLEDVVRIFGSRGYIVAPAPRARPGDAPTAKIIVNTKGEQPQEIVVQASPAVYAIEADHVAAYIEQRQAPAMSWNDSLGNMKTLDRWRESIGLVYESEKFRK
jgi:predicted dehydrogenase